MRFSLIARLARSRENHLIHDELEEKHVRSFDDIKSPMKGAYLMYHVRRHVPFHTVNFYYRRRSELPHTGKDADWYQSIPPFPRLFTYPMSFLSGILSFSQA